MKKKIFSITFLILGIVLIVLSIILTIIACTQVNIIGGAGLPTLLFIFLRQNGGAYAALSFMGLVFILISVVIYLIKQKNNP